ncbi:hypothetical protein SAMN04244560_01481 [Thermoanaerobacter thermohydrosulfuricus]|uniref:Uncharacterized protein n=1 Tax=Thermoanaerobacter thermohydrosulfuricus TaxID=1516 RepID=A0A1G7Q5Q0_THETY|nr:hypothetical protein SAMN04244560_01481 [Thermoanaerobacter thermohydrosulfuricus]
MKAFEFCTSLNIHKNGGNPMKSTAKGLLGKYIANPLIYEEDFEVLQKPKK